MKFYRNTGSIIFRCIGMWLSAIIVIGMMMQDGLDVEGVELIGGPKVFVFIFLLIPTAVICVYTTYSAITHYQKRHESTLEINHLGLRYPYVLDRRILIAWSDIVNIHYTKGNSRKDYSNIIIEVKSHLFLGRMKNTFEYKSQQKKHANPILIISEPLAFKGYDFEALSFKLKNTWQRYR